MEAVNGVADGPPPPSPLTGCYLLVVLGEPHTDSHKDIILQRLAKGLLSWNVNECLVDLEKELSIVTEQGLEGEEARYGERLIQYASENLVTEILIHPSVSTLAQCVRNLLSSFTRHRHIIHAGYTFAANGSWILQDGTFSLADFSEAFQEIDVQRVIHAYENGISIDIHCSAEGEWAKLPKDSFTKGCKLRINPDDVLGSGLPSITNFVNYIAPFLIPAELEHTLESSDVVGNIRFSRPTLYVFPGGQGDAALFGINGFNMLVDGGFSRKACFWDFVRHLDRLDAVILTRLNNSNANGIGAVLRRKAQNAVYPQIGHFFCNIQSRKANLSPDGDKDRDPLLINLLEEGHELISNLRSLDLSPQLCYRDTEPINLYHKVGHGTLDMYVLNPAKDSREVKEFLLRWNNNDQKLFANHKFSREYMLPLQNIVSICALLVWRPANPNDTITRILFPGSAPQGKVIEGLDRLKNLECIKHTVCTERTLVPSSKLKSKENILDKIVPPEKSRLEAKKKTKPTPENKIIENNMKNGLQNGHSERQVTKAGSVESDKSETKSTKPKKEEAKVVDNKQERVPAKPKADSNSTKMKQRASDKKVSPPTPKKVIDTKKSEIDKDSNNQRARSKISPSATPAKSTKDANNRKVLESKTKSAAKKEMKETKQPEKKEEIKKFERKPISRRPKNEMKLPQSPVKRVVNGVHKPDSLSRKGKLDKEGTTDSSTVSTPSVDQDSLMKKDISKLTPEEVQQLKAQELAELKEEQEAIKELEAVFRKGDKGTIEESGLREIKDTSIEDKTEPEEYLIVEKETIEPSPSETEIEIKEEETVKLARDSEESEKRKDGDEGNDDKDKQVDTEQEESGIGEQETDIEDGDDIRDNAISKEPSMLSPEENKRFISKDDELKESQPEEKISANIESGATTTAPTLPEDERIPLNEIKEDTADQIEEKHVREETKEKETKEELPVITLTSKPIDNLGKVPPVVGIRLDKESRIRDIVKTPDEVADLPVHEEADVDHLEEYVHGGTEKTKLKDINQEIDSFIKDETSKGDEKVGKKELSEEKDVEHEKKLDKLPIHDDVETGSPEKKKEIAKEDFELNRTSKESDEIGQETLNTEHKTPTTEIVTDSVKKEDHPDQKLEKDPKPVDKQIPDIKEIAVQPTLEEEHRSEDVKTDVGEKVEVPTKIISSSLRKDNEIPEHKEVISSIIPLSEDAIEKETHVESEILEKEIFKKEFQAVVDLTHDDDVKIHILPDKEEVECEVEENLIIDRESEDLNVKQDIISKENVEDKEDIIHSKPQDKLAETPKEKEVADKLKFKESKTSPITSPLDEKEEKKQLIKITDGKIPDNYDEIQSAIIPKEEKHTEQGSSEEELIKAVDSKKVDQEKLHEPSKEKLSPVASDIKTSKREKEEIDLEKKDKTEKVIDKPIEDTNLTEKSELDEKDVGTLLKEETNLLGEIIAPKVEDKKEYIQEFSEEKQDIPTELKQTSPQKEELISKIPDKDPKESERVQDEIKKEVLSVTIDKDDIGPKQPLTDDEKLKTDISSDENKATQKPEIKPTVESADDVPNEVKSPKDDGVVMKHSEKQIETYEEEAVGSRKDSKIEVMPLEQLDTSDIKLDEDKKTILDETDSELDSKVVEKTKEVTEGKEKPEEILVETTQKETEEEQIKDELHREKKHEEDSLSEKLLTKEEKDMQSTKEHTDELEEKEIDTSVINLRMEESKIDSSEKIGKLPSPEPPTTLKGEKEIKESTLEDEELERPVLTMHELERERKDSSTMSHKVIESRLDHEVEDVSEVKTKSQEEDKLPPKSPEQENQKVQPSTLEDNKDKILKDGLELKKDSLDDVESRIHPEKDEPKEIKHDEKEKSSMAEQSAKQSTEQSVLEVKKEDESADIATYYESEKSPSPSLSQQKIEPPTRKDEETDALKDDSQIKNEEKMNEKIPYSEHSAEEEIESTLDVNKTTPTTDDSIQKIEKSPVSVQESIESKTSAKQAEFPDESKPDDKEKSPILSSKHSEKEEIESVTLDIKRISLTEDSKTIHVFDQILHPDQNLTKLEGKEKSPSSPSNEFVKETIERKSTEDIKSIPADDSDEKNNEYPTTKKEVISSKADPEKQEVQEITKSDEVKRSSSPSSEQSVESKTVSSITAPANKKEHISEVGHEVVGSKEDREKHKSQEIIEHDKEKISKSPVRTTEPLSSEKKDHDETISIKDQIEIKKMESSEIDLESKRGPESEISPEHAKISEKEKSPILEKHADGSITPYTGESGVKQEEHSAETTLENIDSKVEPKQKQSEELLTSNDKDESVSLSRVSLPTKEDLKHETKTPTLDFEGEKIIAEKDDLRIIKSKEEEKPKDHIKQFEPEKSPSLSPELTSREQIEKKSETKDTKNDSQHEKEKPSSPSIEMLEEDTSEITKEEKSEVTHKTDDKIAQYPVLPIKQEEKHEVETPLSKREESDKVITTIDGLENVKDHAKTRPEIIESKEITKKGEFQEEDVETTISKEKLVDAVIPTTEKLSKLEEEHPKIKDGIQEKVLFEEKSPLKHSKSSSPTEIVAKQEQILDMKSETEKDLTHSTEDPLDKINEDIIISSDIKSQPDDRKAQEQSKPDEKEKPQTVTELTELKDLDNKNKEIAKPIPSTKTTQKLIESGDEKSIGLPHENIKDVSDKKIDGESDTQTAEGVNKEEVTEEPFLPFLSKRASLLEEAEVPTKYSEKEGTIDSKDINLNQEYHIPLKSEDIVEKVVKDQTDEIYDSAEKPEKHTEENIIASSSETTELSKILGNLIRDADPDSVLEGSKADDKVEPSQNAQILDETEDQIPTEKLVAGKEPYSEAEKFHIKDHIEQAEEKDIKRVQLDDVHNFLHQERSHTHREMDSSVTDTPKDKKVEDIEKPVTEKPLDELQTKTIETSIQSVQANNEDKEEPIASSTDSNKIDIKEDKEKKSELDHEKELKLEEHSKNDDSVEHIEDENKLEKGMIEAKEKDEDKELDRGEAKFESGEHLMKTEKIKIDLTDTPEHAEAVLLKSTPESPVINIIPSLPALPTDIDKMELGRKSPKEREEDVAKIVASVATVLKSDAPLEEFHGKIPLTTNTPYGGYTTELRETHITTCDSPVHETSILHEELQHQEASHKKIESSHSSEDKDDERLDDQGLVRSDESEDPGTVHRMLVTASSEDGGEEIEICPAGTITFSKSSESSGRSSPENVSRKPSQSSSALDTISDHTTVKEIIESQPKKDQIDEHVSKTSIEHLQSSEESVEETKTRKLYPELDIKEGIKSLEDQIECKVDSSKKKDDPSEMQQSLSDSPKEIPKDTKEIHETVSDKVHSIFGSILSSASKIEETITHALTDTIHSAESTIDEGLKKVESEIDDVKHKITKIESDAIESLSEKKEKAEQLISDRLKESASSLEKAFDETDKEKDSLIQDAQTTLNRISAPLKDTFGDLLSNIADSIKDKGDPLITAGDEKIEKSRGVTKDEVGEKPIPEEKKKETSATETENHIPESSSNLYPSLESEMTEKEKELDKLASTQTSGDVSKNNASIEEQKILPTIDDTKKETDATMKKEEKPEKVSPGESEETEPVILNGLDNEENVSDKTDAETSTISSSTFEDEKQKHHAGISDDILSENLPEIKSDIDKETETHQKKTITQIVPDAQEGTTNFADSKISSSVDTIFEPSSGPQESLQDQKIPSTLEHKIDNISCSEDNMKGPAEDLQNKIITDLEEKGTISVDFTEDSLKGLKGNKVEELKENQESLIHKAKDLEEKTVDFDLEKKTLIDKTKDFVKDLEEHIVEDLREKQESSIHKTKDSMKDLEEKIVDLKEKQESVIDKTKESVKDLKEKAVDDLKERQESLVHKTEDSVRDLVEKIDDLKEKQECVIDKTEELVTDLKEKTVEDLKERRESLLHKTKDSMQDLEEKIVEDLKERQESLIDNTEALETTVTSEIKDIKDSIDSAVHQSKEKLDSVNTEVTSVVKDSKNMLTDFSKDVKEVAELSKENLESSVTNIADEAEKATKSFLSDIKSTIGKALPSFGFSQKEEESTHIENQKHSEEELNKDIGTEKGLDVEVSEKCDKTKQETPSVITDISSIVKEEIESSFKDLIEVEKDATNSIAQKSSNIVDSFKSVKHSALEAGQTVKEDTEKALEEVKDKSVGLLIEGKEKVLQKTSDFESEIEGTKKAIHEKMEDISKNVKDAKENLEDTLSSTKENIESSFSDVVQNIEKEKDALKSVGKEIESELKHAVDDVLSSGKQLFSGIFGKKKQETVEEKPSTIKKEEHDSKSTIKNETDDKKRIADDHEQIQILSELHEVASDSIPTSPKIETEFKDTIKEKHDTGINLEKSSSVSVSESCDISKVDSKRCLEVSPSYEKKLSISDVEIIVGEKLKDSSSDSISKEHILGQDEIRTSKHDDISQTKLLKGDTANVGNLKDKILDPKATSGSSTVDKHITDLSSTESSSKEDVRSITLVTDDLKADKSSDVSMSPVQKSPTQIQCEKTMDSDDDSLGSARSMSSQIPLCKNMDPMSMSFYGALPDEADFLDNDDNEDGDYESSVSFVHLHDITKAKVDGKLVQDSTGDEEKAPRTDKFPVQDPMTSSFYGELPGGKDEKDPIESWGKPLGLPSPAPPNERGTPKKERRLPSNVMTKNRINDDFARSESPSKNKKKINPVYVDLTYVPHHGNSNYAYVDFFKKVRARYYVFSGIEPSREVYNALLEAKQTWEDKDLEVTIIPTYDTDVLGYWVAENEELLAKYKIDLSPSASRCTINLQDHETSCSAYRLEF